MQTVLLIDDDPDFVEATCAVLASVPYRILTAYNGEEGLISAREERPDLILLDIIMPEEDGFRVLERLKSDPALAHIPVMILTSLLDGFSTTSLGSVRAAAEDYIDKPIKPADLLRRVDELITAHGTSNASE